MDFETFTEKMKELLAKRVGDSWEIRVHKALKNNGIKRTGILLQKKGERYGSILYLEEAYEKYTDGMDLEEAVDVLLDAPFGHDFEVEFDKKFQAESFKDYSRVKEHLRLRLINYEKNIELLKDVPHVRWNDLAVIFCYEIEALKKDGSYIMIRNAHLAAWEETVDILYEDALKNMKDKAADDMLSLSEMFKEMAVPSIEKTPPMYVLTNTSRKFGAAVMLYSGKMKELADSFGSDLVIMPSSLHEVLLLADDEEKHTSWREMVREVNRLMVEPEEVLSDNIYRYSREKDTVELLAAG
ncbi:MAG: hypothetical protein K2M70_00325 [Lachnospiraceae bacterium]|nr:hypothetical protein [Lachnospiraceae bacterium]